MAGAPEVVGPGRAILRRLGAFGSLPILTAASALIVLPILSRSASTSQWAAIAIGQSVGGLAALIVDAGWSVTGTARVAQSELGQREHLVRRAASARTVASCLALPGAAVVAGLIPGTHDPGLSIAVALAFTASGLSYAWFAIGSGDARLLLLIDTGPRVVGSLGGALLAVAFRQLLLYPITLGAVMILVATAFTARNRPEGIAAGHLVGGLREVRGNLSGALAQVIAGAYSLGSSALVGIAGSPATVAHFNAGYRIVSFSAVSIAALSSGLQGWVAEVNGPAFLRRLRVSFNLHLGLGLIGLIAMAALGSVATRLLVGARFAASTPAMVAFGVFFFLWSIETVTARHLLVSRGRSRDLLISTAIGSIAGVAGIYVAADVAGYTAAAVALAAALGLIVALQAAVGVRLLEQERRRDADGLEPVIGYGASRL